MAHDVFVSYSSYDKTTADAVCALLEGHGIRCWIAPRDILPGMSWAEAIIDAIEECRVMVLVFSARANASQQIQREVERAVHNGVTIVPLRIEDAKPSKTMEYFISTPHWLDALTPPLEAHIQRLADAVKRLLSRPDQRQELSMSVKMRAYQMGQGEAPPGTGEHAIPVRPPTGEVPVVAPAPVVAPQAYVAVPTPVPAPTPPISQPAPPAAVVVPPIAARPEPASPAVPAVTAPPAFSPASGSPSPPLPVAPVPPAASQPAAPEPSAPAPAPRAATAQVSRAPADAAPKSGFSPMQLGAAAGVVVVLLAVVVGFMMRRPAADAPASATPAAASSAPAPAPATAAPSATPAAPPSGAPAAAATTVVVDAAPWARVSIVPVSGGEAPPASELITPVSLSLAPGEYDVKLENGGVTQPLTRRVTVAAGQPNAFRFTMPGFTPSKVVQELRGGEVKP